ncbi:hypothetical protein ASE00_11735 [Sphingomonas sp. Root710]|uniref:ArdC family protein n=1 Tax=Sphingomonas sp. Root710 TaxID=1736594 RepID=UPI0006F3CDFE|nr:zincin-like metallopeptidase domain-containing protein [Sphingomonas sp. Root710]KRB82697.1 hypothetical protein ASE00_11735 [Sphingomonas sp. Root710]
MAQLYARVTQQIIEAISAGVGDCRMPWHRSGNDIGAPRNAFSKRAYRGLNVVTLWATAEAKGYVSGGWATYRQWLEANAQVRKGEKGTMVYFWENRQAGGRDEGGDEEGDGANRRCFIARSYMVFNADQVEGYVAPVTAPLSEEGRLEKAEAFFDAIGAEIRNGGDQAYFDKGTDHVQMPAFGQFRSAHGYYAVLAHELAHWTGAKHRLDRDMGKRFSMEGRAMEELVAELGAAFIMAELGLANEPRRDHAAYIANWLQVFQHYDRAIFTAAARAQAAADYLIARAGAGLPERGGSLPITDNNMENAA